MNQNSHAELTIPDAINSNNHNRNTNDTYDNANYDNNNPCGCALCTEMVSNENILASFQHCCLMFNRYPYLPGHMMVVPRRPVSTLSECSIAEQHEIIQVLSATQRLLLENIGDSSNIGLNTGPHGGGSIPKHLHFHIIPRAQSDLNFLYVTGGVANEGVQFAGHFGRVRSIIIELFLDTVSRISFFDEIPGFRPNKAINMA